MNATCAERVYENLQSRLEDLRLLWSGYCGDECPKCEGMGEVEQEDGELKPCEFCNETGKLSEDLPDLGNLFEYGLCFDYVAPRTFNDQSEGYFRYQLSWGGPSDEFRIFADRQEYVYRIEYWFLDWFDGAKQNLSGDDFQLLEEIFYSFFVESGTADTVYNKAMKDYEPEFDEDEDES
jgi:hypothetical protein